MKIRGAVLSILLVLSATLSFWVWEKILEKPFLSLAILGYAVVFGFFLLLVKNKVLFWAIPPLTLLLSVFFFTPEINFFYGLILGVAVILYAAELKREEEHSNLKILLKRVLGNSIKTFFTGIDDLVWICAKPAHIHPTPIYFCCLCRRLGRRFVDCS